MALKFCANLSWMFLEHENIADRYQAARNAGFKGVESRFPADHSVEELEQARETAGVEHVLLNAFQGDSCGLAAVPGREAEFRQCLDLSIQYALALKCKRLHVTAGTIPEDEQANNQVIEDWEETYVKNLRYAAQRLKEVGILLLVEPVSTIPGYFLRDTQQAVRILNKVDHNNLKLLLDVFHAQRTHGNLTQTLADLMPHIGHIQISQVPSRCEPDSDGEINYPFIFHQIAKHGYSGWIGCEYTPRGITEDGLAWLTPYLVDRQYDGGSRHAVQ